MVSLGLIQTSCRGFLSGVLIRISLGFLWVSPRVFRVSFRLQIGENIKQKKRKNRTIEVERHRSTTAEKQRSRKEKKQVKQRSREA